MKTLIAKFVGSAGELKEQCEEVLGERRIVPVSWDTEETDYIAGYDDGEAEKDYGTN